MIMGQGANIMGQGATISGQSANFVGQTVLGNYTHFQMVFRPNLTVTMASQKMASSQIFIHHDDVANSENTPRRFSAVYGDTPKNKIDCFQNSPGPNHHCSELTLALPTKIP